MSAQTRSTATAIVRELWLHTSRAKEEWDAAIRSVAATLDALVAEQTAQIQHELDKQDRQVYDLELSGKIKRDRLMAAEAQVERLRQEVNHLEARTISLRSILKREHLHPMGHREPCPVCALLTPPVPPSGEPR